MTKKILLLCVLLMLLFAACNLPSAEDAADFHAQETATAIALDFAATVQAEQQAEESVPENDMMIQNESEETDSAAEDDESLQIQRSSDAGEEEAAQAAVLPTADPNRTPPELPAVFQTDLLNKLDTPHTYVEDTCLEIKNRWGEGKAAPGTVVMAIMYHSIVKGETVEQDNAVTVEQHQQLIRDLHDQGFTAITTEQFIAFMENNDYIPERSVLLIVDDRHSEENYAEHFKPYYEQWGWPVINAWISAEGTTQELWDGNAHAEAEGYVDHQAHGVVHNQPMSDGSTDEYLIGELKGSKDAIEEHFGKTPRAIIWPGGGFGYRPIEIAKEYGYKVGFTTHPRGPVMYNWVPLCDEDDATRPAYAKDGGMDPLFVIPRYWDTDAAEHVDTVRQIGKAAKAYYEANKETELEYYDIVCKPVLGDL